MHQEILKKQDMIKALSALHQVGKNLNTRPWQSKKTSLGSMKWSLESQNKLFVVLYK